VAAPRHLGAVGVASRRHGAVFLLALLGFFAYYSGTLFGVRAIGAAHVGLVVSLLPCITFVIGIIAFGERASVRKAIGTTVAVAATISYAITDNTTGAANAVGAGTLFTGVLLAFGGTTAYALYGYVYRQRMPDVPPVAVLPAVTGVGAVMLGAVAVIVVPLGTITLAQWGGIAILGALLTAPVFLISHELILRKGPLFTSAVALVVPFLIRIGEWALGDARAPGPAAIGLIGVCALGVWLTVSTRAPALQRSGS
jgi:drug/metabolite transporter (DMT)-like permease